MFEIPFSRLPPNFAESLDRVPAEPARPRPAATVVLLRDGTDGPEALLLRRHRSSGFVPGAWVFPGGRVDTADGEPALLARLDGVEPDVEPAPGYRAAAIREVFEETGVLLAEGADGAPSPCAARDPALEALRERLMEDEVSLLEVLEARDLTARGNALVHFAHWITPVVEPRRYDTRFFLAALPAGADARADDREMTDLAWVTPAGALERFQRGELPMVFPTVRTLESLVGFDAVEATLDAFRGREVPAILPRLVRTATGVGITID